MCTSATKTFILIAFLIQDSVLSFAPQNPTLQKRRFLQTKLNQQEESNTEDLRQNANIGSHDPRKSEFFELGELSESSTRRKRIEKEIMGKKRFVKYGNELWDLNDEIEHLSQGLVESLAEGGEHSQMIREKLREAEYRDPNIVYSLELEAMERALDKEDIEKGQVHRELALDAREHLAQYNYQGLWIGK